MKTRAMLLCGLLAMTGCSQNEAKDEVRRPVVDLASIRCPEVPASDLRTLRQAPVPPPPGDLTKTVAQEWIARLGAQSRAKGRAGERLAGLYRRCKGDIEVAKGSL